MMADKYIQAKLRTPARIAAVIIVSLFGVISFQRTKAWKESDELWTDVIRHYPKATLPRGERAQFIYNKAILMNASEAAPLFQRVIEDCTVAINNDTTKEISKKGGRSMHYMRGVSYMLLKQYEKALADFVVCLNINPNDDEVLYSRGSLRMNNFQKNDSALIDFNRAIQLNPQGKYFLSRSVCYYKLGDLTKAKADAQQALQKGTNLPESYRRLLSL